jgi:hypothetical protein
VVDLFMLIPCIHAACLLDPKLKLGDSSADVRDASTAGMHLPASAEFPVCLQGDLFTGHPQLR